LRELVLHTGEDLADPEQAKAMRRTAETKWEFDIVGTAFEATFGLTFGEI
jgi:hypothetical protein